jgi:hypothetical protein
MILRRLFHELSTNMVTMESSFYDLNIDKNRPLLDLMPHLYVAIL